MACDDIALARGLAASLNAEPKKTPGPPPRKAQRGSRLITVVLGLIGALVVIAAAAVLVSNIFLYVARVDGYGMEPTLRQGEIIVAVPKNNFEPGEIIVFHYGENLLVKRVIALAGDTVDMGENGQVSVNGQVINEPYVLSPSLGYADIEFPYQVPDGALFVMGDNRTASRDSRLSIIGSVSLEQVAGKVWLRVWPLNSFAFM